MGKALSQEAFGLATRGNGEQGRSCSVEYQEKYLYALKGRIVVVGRCGIVKDVLTDFTMETPPDGHMLIAQVDFSVGVSDTVHMRVAGIAVDSTVVERPRGINSWTRAVQELSEKSVRVLVLED